ncbi:Ribonuclease 3 [Frankliniella fusca]|uniref:Ribonuclease 3 n=1 Tax=Frankliniella fusca TaxID=407009 RepID=A0AAE1HZB4_9NEOP|nr:Ribonuclease 3 [Frankliniella fusca]
MVNIQNSSINQLHDSDTSDIQPQTSRSIRSTRSKAARLPSPDLFASDEEVENWGSVESEDSFILDSASHSSSPPASPTRDKRSLEISEMIDDSDEERNLAPQKKKKKKRSVKLSKDDKSQKQHLRNTGQEYVTYYSQNTRPARERKKQHTCKRGCHNIVTDDVGDSIFHEYWEQGSYDKRVSYIAARVESCPVKTKRPRLPSGDPNAHPKTVMWKYVFHIHGEAKQVCKQTFLRTLDETDGFLRFAVKKKMKKLSGVTKNDKRGKKHPKHKLTEEKIEAVKQHILKFPSYKSH